VTPTFPARAYDTRAIHTAERARLLYALERPAAVALLVLLSPLMLAVAVAVFALSGRSPLVAHNRIGWRGVPFAMLKFRTMWGGGEARAPFFSIENVGGLYGGAKSADDPRVTSAFAAFCRRYSLDELPQLWHVARGEMSLVGPRPLTLSELREYYGPAMDVVLSLRPGLTGLWQSMGRSRLTYAQRRRLDLLLARRLSPALYFAILMWSVPKLLAGEDAY
jgi:lipopolysaccharide/colanic/teichoic acid biosynthesis glycosyltransferase